MAAISPSLPTRADLNQVSAPKLALLETLEWRLSDVCTLFHSADWSRGAAWLKTIEERSYLCQVEEFQADPIKDLSLARSAIQSSSLGAKFRSSFE
jgi:hypothetical protein